MIVKIKKVKENAKLPIYGTEGAAGMDIYNSEVNNVGLFPGKMHIFPSGIAVNIPKGYVGLLYSRSGLSTKRELLLCNGVGVIDSDYRGEIKVPLKNMSDKMQQVSAGERIAQLIIVPYPQIEWREVEELDGTDRAENGFGSTGSF